MANKITSIWNQDTFFKLIPLQNTQGVDLIVEVVNLPENSNLQAWSWSNRIEPASGSDYASAAVVGDAQGFPNTDSGTGTTGTVVFNPDWNDNDPSTRFATISVPQSKDVTDFSNARTQNTSISFIFNINGIDGVQIRYLITDIDTSGTSGTLTPTTGYFNSGLQEFNNKALNGETLKVVCFGDSITFGFDPDNSGAQVATPYPEQLQTYLRLYYNNNNITVVNKGVSGNQASDLINRFTADIINESPDLVIQMIGINDSNNGVTVLEYNNNLESLANLYLENNISVVFATSTPIRREIGGANFNNIRLNSYVDACISVARKYKIQLANIFGLFEEMFEQGYTVFDFLSNENDTLHPQQAGYIYLAGLFFSQITACFYANKEIKIPIVANTAVISNMGSSANAIFRVPGNEYIANYIFRKQEPGEYCRIPIFVSRKNVQLNANSAKNAPGTIANIRDNGVQNVYTLDFNNPTLIANSIDTVAASFDLGLHILEFNSDDFDAGDPTSAQWYPTAFEIQIN